MWKVPPENARGIAHKMSPETGQKFKNRLKFERAGTWSINWSCR